MRSLLTAVFIFFAPIALAQPSGISGGPYSQFSVGGQYNAPGYGPTARITTYVGPGDVSPGAIIYGSCTYGYSAAYAAPGTNPACTLTRASDSTSKTFNILATGLFDVAGATVFCNSTTCNVTEVWDETGGGNNFLPLSTPTSPILSFNCWGTALTCMNFSGSSVYLAATITTISQPFTFSDVVQRTASFTSFQGDMSSATGAESFFNNVASSYSSFAGSSITVSPTDNVLHSIQNIFDDGDSRSGIGLDCNALATGTVGAEGIGTALYIGAAAGTYLTGTMGEYSLYPSGFTPAQNTTLAHNKRIRYGTPGSC